MQEKVTLHDGAIEILSTVEQGQNIRPQGQDIVQGGLVVSKGELLRPQEVGLLASIGP